MHSAARGHRNSRWSGPGEVSGKLKPRRAWNAAVQCGRRRRQPPLVLVQGVGLVCDYTRATAGRAGLSRLPRGSIGARVASVTMAAATSDSEEVPGRVSLRRWPSSLSESRMILELQLKHGEAGY